MSLFLIVFFVVLLAYRFWFIPGTLSAGDWPYLFVENIREFSFFPEAHFLWLAPYYQIPAKIAVVYLKIPWEIYERIFWFWPFIVLSIASSYYLTRSFVGVLVYTTNTYILMITGGGQMGVALAYSIAPFILGIFIKLTDNLKISNLKLPLIAGLILAIQMMFDPRITYITLLASVLYVAFSIKGKIFKSLKTIYLLLVSIGIGLLLNSYWIVPMLRGNLPQEYKGFGNISDFKFFSFAQFSNTLSLLHPNWPENIFGKIGFMKPEFLVLPILAYSSLLFANSKRKILFFAFLGLLGAFLAKGASEPFGEINLWLFKYFLGMSMFRDPTKWYLLVALSFSFLIPFTLVSIKDRLNSKLPFIIFVIFFIFLARPAILGNLSGTFNPQPVPKEYIELKEFLKSDSEFYTTLWVPDIQRFGFYSTSHPALSSDQFLSLEEIPESKELLGKSKVKYVIVPYDSRKELFTTDRKYDEKKYDYTINVLREIPWLAEKSHFGRIVVFLIQY